MISEAAPDKATDPRAILGDVYASGARPEDIILLDLDLGSRVGWQTFVQLAPLCIPLGDHFLEPVSFDWWRSRCLPEVASVLDSSRRPGHTIMLTVFEEEPSVPGGGGARFALRLLHPDPTRGAEWTKKSPAA